MRVYLAAPYGARGKVRGYAAQLNEAGFVVTSSWLNEAHEITAGTQGAAPALSDDEVAAHAQSDLWDLQRSQALVLFTAAFVGVEGGGGRHVETGYAIALGLPVLVVGAAENVFHRLPTACKTCLGWPEALTRLGAWHRQVQRYDRVVVA